MNHFINPGSLNKIIIVLSIVISSLTDPAKAQKQNSTNIIAGLSGPEMLHAGVSFRVANTNLLGINAGIGPSSGQVWTSINAEHRFYFGKNDPRSNMKAWFGRQGITYFPSGNSNQNFAATLTAGKDLSFKKAGNGITIDAGVFYLPESESSSIILIRSLNLWPALRFELYFGL